MLPNFDSPNEEFSKLRKPLSSNRLAYNIKGPVDYRVYLII